MYKNSIRNVLLPILFAVAIIGGIIIGKYSERPYNIIRATDQMSKPGAQSIAEKKVLYTISLIDNMYVDSVNIDTLCQQAIIDLVGELDPHSVYIPAQDFGAANEGLDGEFDGIGVVFNMTTDTVIVLNVIPAGPSEKAGILSGDRIIKIGDSLVAGQKINQNSVVKMLRGKRGTKVDLSLKRQGIEDLVPVTVTRGVIPLKSLDAAFMIEPQVGFVKLTTFSRNSYTEVAAALAELKKQGMKKLIFDLRGNNGGFLDQAIDITNEFLPKGKMIVYTENRRKERMVESSDGQGGHIDLNMVVLVDEGSASSSEIMAGAIQDNDRGLVIGRRTYGKGLVQQQIPYGDGSALRLTISRYYTPTGRSIQRPYIKGDKGEYSKDMINRIEHSELFSADSIKFADTLKFTTPGGRTVYGGGGIMPDIFVPLDTTQTSKYYREVWGRNILFNFTMNYADKHRDKLNAVESVEQLNSLLDADKTLLDDFIKYASQNGVKYNYADIKLSNSLLKAQLRATIGRNTPLGDVGFYSNIYKEDNVIVKALEELKKE